ITFDTHGFGQSGVPTAPFAFHTDIIALLDHFRIDKAWFMAASVGGALTLDVELMHRQRVQGLILVAPAIAGYKYEGERDPLYEKIGEAEENGDLDLVSELEVQLWVDGKGRKADELDPAMRQLVVE